MPTVINGIGTWYYGQRNIFKRKGICDSCQSFGSLKSYDTTLFFVVVFIPLIPITRKRILDQCQRCQKHRVLKLAEWERQKANVFSELTESLKSGTDAPTALTDAIGAACGFQDQRLFDQIAAVATDRGNDANLQMELGAGYAHFSRWEEAESAYRRSLQIKDSVEVRDRLASVLLKLGRPDEARTLINNVIETKDESRSWLVFLLVEAYQAAGRHDDALELMDLRDATFPDHAVDKDCKMQRQLSVKYAASGKPVPSKLLSSGRGPGFSEGSAWRSKTAWIIGPLVVIGLLMTYLISAWYIGNHRKIYLVNGTNRPYAVTINEQRVQLTPNVGTPVVVGEGDVTVNPLDIDLGPAPLQCRIESPFYSRPFVNQSFVINPDRLAIMVWEETEFSDQPRNRARPPEYRAGELLYSYSGVDYDFAPFPAQLRAKRGSHIIKQRISAETPNTTLGRWRFIRQQLQPDQQAEYLRRMVQLDPNDATALGCLAMTLPSAEMLEFVRPKLAVRPAMVDWHRWYQSLMEMTQPDTDLRPEYRKLVEESRRSGDSLYLLGRIEEEPAAGELYSEAVRAKPASVAALGGMAFRCLSQARFADAVKAAEQATILKPNDQRARQVYRETLIAAGQFDKLSLSLVDSGDMDSKWESLRFQLLTLATKNKWAEAKQLVDQFPFSLGITAPSPESQQISIAAEQLMAGVFRDRAGYLKNVQLMPQLESALTLILENKLTEAAAKAHPINESLPASLRRDALQDRGLLYLLAEKSQQADLAKEQLAALIQLLNSDDRESRWIAGVLKGDNPFDWEKVRLIPMDPETKRVILAVLAQKFPDHANQLQPMALQLDYHRDGVSLCLRSILEG